MARPSNDEKAQLSAEQQVAVTVATEQRTRSLLITGPAGTGKSYVLRKIIEKLTHDHEVAVTASTGAAAFHVKGVTIHSWAGIGIGDDPVDTIYERIIRYKDVARRWRNTDVLVIDEISMLSAQTFDLLEELARKMRRNGRPFGGLKLVMCGDFAQVVAHWVDNDLVAAECRRSFHL